MSSAKALAAATLVGLVALLGAAAAGAGEEPARPPTFDGALPAMTPPGAETAELLTLDIASGLRCPICQGLSVADSPVDLSRSMRDQIGEMVRQGYSREQINAFFVDRYGEWVLLAPPPRGFNLIVWLAPAGALLIGAMVVVSFVRKQGRTARGNSGQVEAPGGTAAPDDEYQARVLAELEREE
ncbi:MAG: cytochrome c-type biogenesis protein CcmH [Candidatus Schekmanbacteria bacterium]|nr:cytochrome c-type biogenesis protein CcmH [Candidatus Schekmanbacteria bacterium]